MEEQKNYSTSDLLDLISSISNKEKNEERKPEDFRYVVYCRKSSDDKRHQIKSLPDQVSECLEFAERNKLRIVGEPITEAQSAKEPDIRPKFRQMMIDLRNGKFDGIISWHPDRLARNMKEAGEIIDFLDKKIIKDLKFVTFTFNNDTAGITTLGILFVLSKQYSDALSTNVKRGNLRSVLQGKWLHATKFGYFKDPVQLLRPDGNNFFLIGQAWKMRLQKRTYEEIADYLNRNGLRKAMKNEKGELVWNDVKVDEKTLTRIFQDPTYAGIMKHGEDVVNLTEIYDFQELITPDDFIRVNHSKDMRTFLNKRERARNPLKVKANFLRGRVLCGDCLEPMSTGITVKPSGKRYFYFRCETADCKNVDKSVRGKVITEYVYDFLEHHIFDTKEAYEDYKVEMASEQKRRDELLKAEKSSLENKRRLNEKTLSDFRSFLAQEDDLDIQADYKKDIKRRLPIQKEIEASLVEVTEAIENNKIAVEKYERFLELTRQLPDALRKTKSLSQKDALIREIFSNFTAKGKKVLDHQLEEPFKTFVEKGHFSSCRAGGTRTHDLAHPMRAF